MGFYVNWDESSRSSLREHLNNLDVLVPEWLHLSGSEGDLSVDDEPRTTAALDLIAEKKPDLKVLPLVNNYLEGQWRVDELRQTLANERSRERFVANLLAYVEENGLAGVTIGLQGMQVSDRQDFMAFAEDLHDAFDESGLLVYHTLSMRDRSLDATELSKFSDAIIVLGEGESWSSMAPGPLASQAWFEAGLERRATEIPADKLVVSLANMARDWSPNGTETYSVQEAFSRARQGNATIEFDPEKLNPSFRYTDGAGPQHTVWMLDAVTAFNHWQWARGLNPRGLAIWRLGTEDPSTWTVLANPLAPDPQELRVITFSNHLDRYGAGEITRLTGLPQNGSRVVDLAADGRLIGAEAIRNYPRSFEVMQWGADDKKLLALTFDDGPDPTFTPKILDVLKQYDVPATFFMVGQQMLNYPEILQRVMDEGHEVGSHTYTHANIAKLNPELLRVELNATQRVFESITGRNLVMFRPPYATDTNPQTVDEIRPLKLISEMGYLSVNMNIDSRDWWLPNTRRIIETTLSEVSRELGNVVLLHDGGGNRQHTVDALPEIIERARAMGYRFVTISALVGKTRDEVMPLAEQSPTIQLLQTAGFGVMREFGRFLGIAFVLAIALGIARSTGLIVLSIVRRRHRRKPSPPTARRRHRPGARTLAARRRHRPRPLTVAVIVPAYNEEKVVVQTVRSLLSSSLPDLQVLVVDDGSKDDTFELCRTTFLNEKRVKVITKPNGGKAAALNLGFRRLKADIVIGMDADTILLPDAIERLLEHFADPRVAAVSGNAKVGNRVNLLTRWQALEYITAQNLDRRAFDRLNCIPVVPGAIGAWRRRQVIAAGGFTSDTLAEDADLTMRLLRAGHVVTYEEQAIALTEAPETVRQFNKQRFRWMYGTLQVAFKHLGALRLRDSKTVGLVALPNTLVFQIMFPLLAPFADFGAVLAVFGLGWDFITDSTSLPVDRAAMFLTVFFVFMLVDFAAAACSFWHERDEDWWLLLWLLPQRFFYRQLLYIVAIKAVLQAIRGTAVGWGTLTRTANVAAPPPTPPSLAPRPRA